MRLSGNENATVGIEEVLQHVLSKGVQLWSENGELHYRARKGVLNREELERLSVCKEKVVALLERSMCREIAAPRLERRHHSLPVPLTYSQLSHWNRFRLGEQRHVRQVASGTLLQGELDIDALRKSIAEVIRRHEALRTRIVVVDGIPKQEVVDSTLGDGDLEVEQLTSIPEGQRSLEVQHRIEQFILTPIDVTVDPLFAVKLLQLTSDRYVLITGMEHMISDGYSRNILLRDVLAAYQQASMKLPFALPEVCIQYADYAAWQRSMEHSWLDAHAEYWRRRLAGKTRLRFPVDNSSSVTERPGWGAVPVRIAGDLMIELKDWCRVRRTTPVMSVFTAYAALVMRWCGASDAVIRFQTDGRVSREVLDTIGYFAFALHLRVVLGDTDSLLDLLDGVREEYCEAYEHADSSYIEAQSPRPDIALSTEFNWVPGGLSTSASKEDGEHGSIVSSPVPFVSPLMSSLKWDAEPAILLFDMGYDVVGRICFPLNRFSADSMSRFGRNFALFIETMVKQPKRAVKSIPLL